MTEVAQQVGISITSKIAEVLVEPTISRFRHGILDELKPVEQNLAQAMTRVENQVNMARYNAEVIEKDVEKWMADSATAMKEVQHLKDEIQQDKRCFEKRCPNWLWRYRLSKKMAKMAISLKELAGKGKFTTVSHPAPLLDIEILHTEALTQIMEALKDDNISMIGLYGMGGVGKTTLAKEVANKVNELKLFDEVVFVVVSKNQVLSKIQDQIADKLGVKFNQRSEKERADHLARRLQDERKKLVILDDVWEYLKLEDIGILFSDDQCKILLTTRLQNVCTSMDCQRQIPLNVLNEHEGWALFKKNAGLSDNSLAMEVAKECKGLPIAIVIVGRALKKITPTEWQLALDKLKNSRLPEIRDIDHNAYNNNKLSIDHNAYTCLKFSLDELHRGETKSCLLLCSLFPEDSEIFVERLVEYAVGLDLYGGTQTVEKTREKVLKAIADLKDSYMLLETDKEGYVKMHDVVRDFMLRIGSQEENVFKVKAYDKFSKWQKDPRSKNYKAVSIIDNVDFGNYFFQEMKQLKVVSLVNAYLSTRSLRYLENIQILELVSCKINENFGPILMELERLQILRCWDLDIKELPAEVGNLKNLKVLDLQGCRMLQRISSGIIKKLRRLEELYLADSFSKWESSEVINAETRNASLIELNSLSNLAILWLRLEDAMQIPRDFMFPKLSGYSIHLNCFCDNVSTLEIGHPKPNQLCVEASKVNACKNLLEDVLELKLSASNSSSFGNLMPDIIDASGFNDLISLDVCKLKMECLIDAKLWQQQQKEPKIGFSNLKKLHVEETTIREICNGQPPQGFLKSLTSLFIGNCSNLKTIFSPSLARSLLHLQKLDIRGCIQLKHVISVTEMEEEISLSKEKAVGNDLILPNLISMDIAHCSSLEYVFPISVASQGLPRLEEITLRDNEKLKCVFKSKTTNNTSTTTTIDDR